MSALIDSAHVERTWQRLGALSPRDMLKLQRQSGKLQPELVGFVIGSTNSMSPHAIGLALYVMIVVLEMFRVTPVKKMRKANEATIVRLWRESQEIVGSSLNAPAGFDPLALLLAGSSEPAAFEYVFDALTEPDPEDPVELDTEELEHLMAVLRTFVEALHHSCGPPGI